MKDTGYCEYCMTETPCGHIVDTVGHKDLIHYPFKFMDEDLSVNACIQTGELIFSNFDDNAFLSVKINYCPMCGRKLEHWEWD